MNSQSDHLRDQAERAERLSKSVNNEEASRKLAELSQSFRNTAAALDSAANDPSR
ncbi:MAG: hypothetical protein JOY90_05815 [Bradyrhizobium sp.]|uniref:hypothetical protein n=1 Tax=Bradyrhizobium sp. TaxID=376 RepID=UPI001E0ED7DD|nr:hypothetical protein [Bradyrhizobium sp.]MBV9559966.1 hypothetical protein [Bradyrhizobium sp.]